MSNRSLTPLALCAALSLPAAVKAQTDEAPQQALDVSIAYKIDAMAIDAGRGARRAAYLDDIELTASVSLDRAIGWRGATAFVGVLNNMGGRPNDTAGTLQGVNNIEVGAPKARFYQAWVQQSFAGDRLSVLAGRYDINSEFYHNDAAGQLIGPAFGMGSELASTGPNGPSTFPLTDLAVRGRAAQVGYYGQAAVVRAPGGVIAGGGPRATLMIAELGRHGRTSAAAGVWTYSRRQPLVDPPGVTIAAGAAASRGAYVLLERDIAGRFDSPHHWRAFLRTGISDGRTTPFSGGMQLGVAATGLIATRPKSALSAGFATARLSERYRRANPSGEPPFGRGENVFELTYSDRLLPFLTVQPDVQYVRHPSGLRDADDVVVLILRAIVDWKLP